MSTRTNEAMWDETRSRWEIRAMRNGVRKKFTSSKPGRKGKLEAERKADAWIDFAEENITTPLYDPNALCETLLADYVAYLKEAKAHGDYLQQEGFVRRDIQPIIGPIRIGRLTEGDLQDIIDRAFKKKKLSQKTLKNIRAVIMAWLKWCRKHGRAKLHPEDLIIPKAAKRPHKRILQPEGLRILFSSERTSYRRQELPEWYIHAYRYIVITGWRPGETIGLKNSYLRDGGKKVVMEGAINYFGEETEGKNGNARRTVVLPEYAQQELKAQREMLKKAGVISPYVFPMPDGSVLKEYVLYKAWCRYCNANGIPHISLYELRHTFVSMNKEMPEGLKKMVVGHSRDMDTEGVYGHQMQGDLEKAAGYQQAALLSILEQSQGDQ